MYITVLKVVPAINIFHCIEGCTTWRLVLLLLHLKETQFLYVNNDEYKVQHVHVQHAFKMQKPPYRKKQHKRKLNTQNGIELSYNVSVLDVQLQGHRKASRR